VMQVELTADKKMAKGVTLLDKDGNLCFQPADLVIISAYQMDNVRLMLLSGIGKPYDRDSQTGVVGRDYSYQTISSSTIFMPDDFIQNPFVGAGALAKSVDDFNSDNFDHTDYDFIGGANIVVHSTGGRPIARGDAVPAGSPRWGSQWKKEFKQAYQASNSLYAQGTSHGHRDVFLDLDPTYKDRLGRPLLRVTFDWNENDKKSAHFISDRCEDIAKAMRVKSHIRNEPTAKPFTPMANLSSHTIGGAVMGDDPNTSALNRYLQSWDVPNVFVPGANAFANNGGYNPTGTVGALTLWSAHHIINQYLKAPGALVQA
jgi:gluconate 2-dehydrogenase alpha chain